MYWWINANQQNPHKFCPAVLSLSFTLSLSLSLYLWIRFTSGGVHIRRPLIFGIFFHTLPLIRAFMPWPDPPWKFASDKRDHFHWPINTVLWLNFGGTLCAWQYGLELPDSVNLRHERPHRRPWFQSGPRNYVLTTRAKTWLNFLAHSVSAFAHVNLYLFRPFHIIDSLDFLVQCQWHEFQSQFVENGPPPP